MVRFFKKDKSTTFITYNSNFDHDHELNKLLTDGVWRDPHYDNMMFHEL